MNQLNTSFLSFLLMVLFISSTSLAKSYHSGEEFLQCLYINSQNFTSTSSSIYTPNTSSYQSILDSSIQNLRFSSSNTPKPLAIIAPFDVTQVQESIYCSKKHGVEMRIRSGGHDYEGLSYVSKSPFFIVDLRNLRAITMNVRTNTAWVQAGATLGEVYYNIAKESRTLAFPAGTCPTVGVGGHFSGGGYSMMSRKYGLAADNIIDAQLIDVNGRILNRESMGEDLFWAIRGGGGASFGVIISWKIKLVHVPEKVTIFNVVKTLNQNATALIHQWQHIANKVDKNLLIRIFIRSATQNGNRTIQASFTSLFLGQIETLIPIMQQSFPELGVVREDCTEMSWIESTLYFTGFPTNSSLEVLLNRTRPTRSYAKAKSDYVKVPIPSYGLQGIWERLYEEDVESTQIQLSPYGGIFDEISESEIPFPHRYGNMYMIHYLVRWTEENQEAELRISWIKRLYKYMAPYVSNSPRVAYLNYRDLDLGVNSNERSTSSRRGKTWGVKYFKNNFNRLVHVKTMIDPQNFFKNEQSIPLAKS